VCPLDEDKREKQSLMRFETLWNFVRCGVGKKYAQSKIPLQVHFQMQPWQQQVIIPHTGLSSLLLIYTDRFAALNKGMVAFKVVIKLSRKRGNSKKDLDEEADGEN
jgi:hypothetical protein